MFQDNYRPFVSGPYEVSDTEIPPFNFAGFWIRLGAYLIDVIPLFVARRLARQFLGSGGYDLLAEVLIFWLYFAGLESTWGATPGKLVLDLRVVDAQGNRPSLVQATVRAFSKCLSCLLLFIGFLMIGINDAKRGLHDMIAETYVVHD
jgi:uncharacterized RDD family membrane protein YckC